MDENPPIISTNPIAIFSVVATIFTLLFFCVAVAPIPFTGWVCYPAAALTGLTALATGLTSLYQIRATGENGRIFGLIGAWIGGLATLASICALILGVLWLPMLVHFIRQIIR